MNKRHPLWEMLPPWRLAGTEPTAGVLLALSGGADSRALLHVLSAFARRDGFAVEVAHVNHGIRGAEAERDAQFCRGLAEEYGWEFHRLDADVPALAEQNKRSLELEAREVRYAYFEKLMRERDLPILVTAHHGDDNLETVLFRLCRGTGLHGLVGIPPVRKFANGVLVRPMLRYSRREILAFCHGEGLTFVTDSTNAKAHCSRNRIRLEAIPALEACVANPQNSVYRMTRFLSDDLEYLNGEAKRFLEAQWREGGVSAEALRTLHPAIRRRVIGMMLPKMLEAVHLTAVEELLEQGRSGTSVSLPADLCACLQNGRLLILPDLRVTSPYPPFPAEMGDVRLCDGKLTLSVKKYEKLKIESNVHNTYTSSCIIVKGTMESGVYFRARQNGDVMKRNGVNRPVRRLYREAGVPTAVRDGLPLLCGEDEILWIPFVGYADGVKRDRAGSGDFLITVRIEKTENERTLQE